MATLTELKDGIRDTLEDPVISGLTVYPNITPQVNYPAVVIRVEKADFTAAFARGLVIWEFNLDILVGSNDGFVSEVELDELVSHAGPRSIAQAIYFNRGLGLLDTDAVVNGMTDYMHIYATAHVGATLRMTINTSGIV